MIIITLKIVLLQQCAYLGRVLSGFGFGDYRNGCKPTKHAGLYNVPSNSPAGMKRRPSPSPNRVKTRGDAGFGAPLPS